MSIKTMVVSLGMTKQLTCCTHTVTNRTGNFYTLIENIVIALKVITLCTSL